MTRYTVSSHYLICRQVVFLRDSRPMTEAERWFWVILKPSTPIELCDVTDPAVLLLWAEHAGHAETKFECEMNAVKEIQRV